MAKLTEREKQIGARLREFRENILNIPRARFAVLLGIGGERLASYEAGRVVLPYQVFRVVTWKFHLSPFWLATGKSDAKLLGPYTDNDFLPHVKARMAFSQVYDAHIVQEFILYETNERSLAALNNIVALLKDKRGLKLAATHSPRILKMLVSKCEDLLKEVKG